MEIISKYFPNLSEIQRLQFAKLYDLYSYWNEQINVVSRQDIDNLYEHHVLHSLAIAKVMQFAPKTTVMDVGTGGGFPGIPLAILFPETHFYLCDSVRRKMKVVSAVADDLNLKNVTIDVARSEQVHRTFDFVVSRAVSKLPKFTRLVMKNIHQGHTNAYGNGIIYLKGGDFEDELEELETKEVQIFEVKDHFTEEYFETKKVVYIPFHTLSAEEY